MIFINGNLIIFSHKETVKTASQRLLQFFKNGCVESSAHKWQTLKYKKLDKQLLRFHKKDILTNILDS